MSIGLTINSLKCNTFIFLTVPLAREGNEGTRRNFQKYLLVKSQKLVPFITESSVKRELK